MKKLRLGTRGSALALCQSRWVADRLEAACPGWQVELVVIQTTGDLRKEAPMGSLGGKGVFTREIEVAMLRGEVDFAVHSLKDLPTELPEGLKLAAFPIRQDPRDALISHGALRDLAAGGSIGTGSLRRQFQLRAARPDLRFEPIRGNVPTRVEKWRRGEYQGVVLAMAGIRRLGMERLGLSDPEVHALPPELCLPAPGQGILGLQCRAGDPQTQEQLSALSDPKAEVEARAERAFLRKLEGGCNVPAGALARAEAGGLTLDAVLGSAGHDHLERVHLQGRWEEAENLGQSAAARLLATQKPA
ncbi:MAG: hydroxymethylbilane synthase [Armatimonadetes bacterium]|nr:hydroxymethylbilane synthase [Armatimonadota bacterium]